MDKTSRAVKEKRDGAASRGKTASKSASADNPTVAIGVAAALEEARRAGLLDGARTEHVSFRVTAALVEAAKRESGVSSPTELGIVALAMLAQPDPAATFLKCTRGRIGAAHTLEY